jgi:hypothetical protein
MMELESHNIALLRRKWLESDTDSFWIATAVMLRQNFVNEIVNFFQNRQFDLFFETFDDI